MSSSQSLACESLYTWGLAAGSTVTVLSPYVRNFRERDGNTYSVIFFDTKFSSAQTSQCAQNCLILVINSLFNFFFV